MRSRSGFSLIEMLLALGLLSLLMGTALSFLTESQKDYVAELAFNEALQNARNALDVLDRSIRQAGNDPRKRADDPCHPAHHPCMAEEPIIGDDHQITLRADLTGSIGQRGDPDCSLGQRFEDITFRFDPAAHELKMRSGSGRFEPIAQNLAEVRFEYYRYNAEGQVIPADRPCAIHMVRVMVIPAASDPARRRPVMIRYPLTLDVQIRSRR